MFSPLLVILSSNKVTNTHHFNHVPHLSCNQLYSCCVLFSEQRSAEQIHPESGAEHHHGTERSKLVIFITSRKHRASTERWSSLHFTHHSPLYHTSTDLVLLPLTMITVTHSYLLHASSVRLSRTTFTRNFLSRVALFDDVNFLAFFVQRIFHKRGFGGHTFTWHKFCASLCDQGER